MKMGSGYPLIGETHGKSTLVDSTGHLILET